MDLLLQFKQYMEKIEQQPNYVDVMQDELGIDPKTFEKHPEWAASVSLGNITYNGIVFKIVRMVKKGNEIVGAMVKPMNVHGATPPRAYIGSGDKQMRSPSGDVDSAEVFWPKERLNAMLTQGMNAASASAGLPGPSGGGL